MKYAKSTILFFTLLISFNLLAQRYYGPRRGGSTQIIVNGGLGYYIPSFKYLNDDSYLEPLGASFNGGPMIKVGGDIKVMNSFFVGAGTGYFFDKAEVIGANTGGIVRDESLRISIIPLTFQVKYELELEHGYHRRYGGWWKKYLRPFAGLGVTYNLIGQKWERTLDGETSSGTLNGTTVSYLGIAGVRYIVTRGLEIGVEYNHVLGSFDQAFESDNSSTVENISLTGPGFFLHMSYNYMEAMGRR